MPSDASQEGALLAAIETHDVDALRQFAAGAFDFARTVQGKTPVQWLLEMYLRSERFPACLRLLLDHGGRLDDPFLTAVLLDDAEAVRALTAGQPALLTQRYDLVSAFTPLLGATALHVAAEYGNAAAASALLRAGASTEATATAEAGDGHTPLFHTVCSILDHGAPVLRLLLAAGARTDVRLPSLTWGRGLPWETTLFDVTPLSYCQAGLLPQMHRREADVWRNVRTLLTAAGRNVPPLPNVPNRYLQPRRS